MVSYTAHEKGDCLSPRGCTAGARNIFRDGPRLVAQRLSIPRLTGLERFRVEIRRRPLPRHGTDHDSEPLPSFPRFCLPARPLSADKKSIEVAVRPRKGSAAVCSRCHRPARGYDKLAERRFEFTPLWGFFVFLLYTMRRVECRRCAVVAVEEVPWGDGKRTLTRAYMLFLARWARKLSWKETSEAFRTSREKVSTR